MPSQKPGKSDIPARFRPSGAVLLIDRVMTQLIRLGGILVISAVLGIFVFIFFQVIPLFKGASVKLLQSYPVNASGYSVLGIDEWSEYPFLADSKGRILFIDVKGDRGNTQTSPPFEEAVQTSAVAYGQAFQQLVYGTEDGRFSVVDLNYSRAGGDEKPRVNHDISPGPLYQLGSAEGAVRAIAYGKSADVTLVAGIVDGATGPEVHASLLRRKRSLLGPGEVELKTRFDLTPYIDGEPTRILVDSAADAVLVATRKNAIHDLFRQGETMELRQTLKPFGDLEEQAVASMDFLFGDVSIVLTNPNVVNRVFSLFIPENENRRLFGQTKEFPSLASAATFYAGSLRNKSFLIGNDRLASLRYSTTEAISWEDDLPFEARLAVISAKYNRIAFLDEGGKLHLYELHDPHPETNLKGLFGKVWYEGYPEPSYDWQSSSATDDFEMKLSLVPLIFGTLKGTLYAMLFALPIAILAAMYTSQFLDPNIRLYVKPTMEIMASLPSVVLGFLAALWLAPILETQIPSLLAVFILVPASALGFGWFWSRLSPRIRRWINPGWEVALFVPILLLVSYLGWRIGPTLEGILFVVTDPATGEKIADFRRWWPEVTGTAYEQRNSLVVGFMMGFAVIPIIFTITEDALSNVPGALRSASLALGASRWQTAFRVVLPTASAGIFSACMIGLGRAVGETMIVVMATGNTPILEWNIFSGMRTLSANIAVELPEAPHHGTLYRTLFLGGMVLFIMTFLINTIAEVLRHHLREKYKTV